MSSDPEPDLPVMLSRLSSIDCAADYIDNLIERLALCVSLGVGELGGDLDYLLAAVASACVTFKSAARRLCSHRLQWLEKECEELDGVEKALLACSRLCECSGVDWDELAASVAPSLHLVECYVFPRQSCVMNVDMCAVVSVRDALSRCSGVVDGSGCVGRGAELAWVDPSDSESAFQHNSLALEWFYSTGDAIRSGGTGLDVADFSLSLSPSPHSRAMFAIEGSTLILRFTLNAPVAPGDAVTVDVLYLDRPFFRTQSKVGRSVFGNLTGTILLETSRRNYGVAVSPDGAELYVSNFASSRIHVYSLPEGSPQRQLGGTGDGPGQFHAPLKLAIAPWDSTHLLVSENYNRRVQEITTMGEFIRFIGVGVISSHIQALAVDMAAVAVGSFGLGGTCKVMLFDSGSGALLRQFAPSGRGPGECKGCSGMRFSPDGAFVFIADADNSRIAVFTRQGEFVRNIGQGVLATPDDIDFATNGDLIIADCDNSRICVLPLTSPGLEPDIAGMRTFAGPGVEPGLFTQPTSLAFHRGSLFVLEYGKGRVQVFT